jgi:hypothetical protein
MVRANIPYTVNQDQAVDFAFAVNGDTEAETIDSFRPGAGKPAVAPLTAVLDLTAGDYVEPFVSVPGSGTAEFAMRLGIGNGLSMVQWGGAASGAEDLLSVAQSLGAVLLFDVYDAANYVLSGAEFVSIKNLISDVDHNVVGTAPTYSATDFNGGPGVVFGGAGWFVGSESAVIAAMTDNNPHTLVVARRFDSTNRHLFAVADSASASGYRLYGVLTADSFTQTRVDGGSAATIQATNDDDGAEHIDTWLRVGGGSPTIQLIRDNATTILGPQTQTTPTLTPNNYAWGTSPDDTPTSFPMLGGGSLVILFPSALDASQRSTLFDAIANHHAALGGLL